MRELRRRGFTLIELLVVIAVIAVLAAILFPVFAQTREAARKATCQSNLKQLGSAIMMYVQDYDETFPGAAAPDGSWDVARGTVYIQPPEALMPVSPASPRRAVWSNLVQPYVKNWQIFKCPSTADVDLFGPATSGQFNPKRSFSYTMNGLLFAYPLAGLVTPARNILVWEGIGDVAIVGGAQYNPVIANIGTAPAPRIFQDGSSTCTWYNFGYRPNERTRMGFHAGGLNYLYSDGHVKWVRSGSTESAIGLMNADGTWATYWIGAGNCLWYHRPTVQ